MVDEFKLELPVGAKILSIKEQRGVACVWALVEIDPEIPNEVRRFRLAGTGHPILVDPDELKFVGSVLLRGGDLVFHLFEVV
jgi:hypothetical protein